MTRINVDPIMTLPDGSDLVISTQCLKDGVFTCALYSVRAGEDERAHIRIMSDHLSAATCLAAQEYAYHYALRIYPGAISVMKRPPYLIWRGPITDTQS